MESKTGIVLGFSVFYAIIITLLGFYGGTFDNSNNTVQNGTGLASTWNIVAGIETIPTWMNVVLFGSMLIAITWLITSSLPTLSGGS